MSCLAELLAASELSEPRLGRSSCHRARPFPAAPIGHTANSPSPPNAATLPTLFYSGLQRICSVKGNYANFYEFTFPTNSRNDGGFFGQVCHILPNVGLISEDTEYGWKGLFVAGHSCWFSQGCRDNVDVASGRTGLLCGGMKNPL